MYVEIKEKVAGWLKNKSYEDTKRFFFPPKSEHILDLASAMSPFDYTETCWIKGKLRLSVRRNSLYYIVYGSCGITVEAALDWNVECSGCGVLSLMEIKGSLL